MRSVIRVAAAGLGAVVVALFATLMALILAQVLNRFLLGFQMFWTAEVIRLLLVWTVLLATPLTLLWRHEIKVDLLHFGHPGLQRGKIMLAAFASILFCAILAKTGYDFALRGLNARSTTLGISRVWFYAPIPIGAALSVIALLVRPAAPAAEADTR